ncbi:MAG TPA: malectin domain-containing carbohydrate-binding protein, partial [bacterium]|nr:malectin domain-containing carbohydrate-binding protein [bacterium]
IFSLLTGEPLNMTSPITGESLRWTWKRDYGCNYPIACENFVSFRSAAAGYYDLENQSGTGHFGGFKSGCTSNLIAADGVLNAPDYTRTCSCSYQNQTSLAMVHMPDNEAWTFTTLERGKEPIQRLGINLGAPGDRVSETGTVWLEYPIEGGPSPKIIVSVSPEKVIYHRVHSSRVAEETMNWVFASGVTGLDRLSVQVGNKTPSAYSVRLFFCETRAKSTQNNSFDVALQGLTVLRDFDVLKESGGLNQGIVKEFAGVAIGENLEVTFASDDQKSTLLSGIEIVAEQ